MDRKQWIEQVADTFAANPEAEKFHVCKDAQCFRTEHAAREHERMLGVGAHGVELVTRESVERWMRGEPAKKKEVAVDTGAGEGEQGGEGSGTEAAASDQSAGADTDTDSDSDSDSDVERAKKALQDELDQKAQEPASAPKKAAPKKTAAKKAATKKTTKKK